MLRQAYLDGQRAAYAKYALSAMHEVKIGPQGIERTLRGHLPPEPVKKVNAWDALNRPKVPLRKPSASPDVWASTPAPL